MKALERSIVVEIALIWRIYNYWCARAKQKQSKCRPTEDPPERV